MATRKQDPLELDVTRVYSDNVPKAQRIAWDNMWDERVPRLLKMMEEGKEDNSHEA